MGELLHSLLTVSGGVGNCACVFKEIFCYFKVKLVILNDKQLHSRDIRLGLVIGESVDIFCACYLKGEGHGEGRSHIRLALYVDSSAHFVDKGLDYCHAQTGSTVACACVVFLLGERLENVFKVFLAHSYARVCDDAPVMNDLIVAAFKQDLAGYLTRGLVVLYGIAENVQEYLADVKRAAVNIRISELRGAVAVNKGYALLCGTHSRNDKHVLGESLQIKGRVFKPGVLVLQPAHFQNVVYKAQQVICGYHCLITVFLLDLFIVALAVYFKDTDYSVKGRSDIVGHS